MVFDGGSDFGSDFVGEHPRELKSRCSRCCIPSEDFLGFLQRSFLP